MPPLGRGVDAAARRTAGSRGSRRSTLTSIEVARRRALRGQRARRRGRPDASAPAAESPGRRRCRGAADGSSTRSRTSRRPVHRHARPSTARRTTSARGWARRSTTGAGKWPYSMHLELGGRLRRRSRAITARRQVDRRHRHHRERALRRRTPAQDRRGADLGLRPRRLAAALADPRAIGWTRRSRRGTRRCRAPTSACSPARRTSASATGAAGR